MARCQTNLPLSQRRENQTVTDNCLNYYHSGFKKALEYLGHIEQTIKERNWKKEESQSPGTLRLTVIETDIYLYVSVSI